MLPDDMLTTFCPLYHHRLSNVLGLAKFIDLVSLSSSCPIRDCEQQTDSQCRAGVRFEDIDLRDIDLRDILPTELPLVLCEKVSDRKPVGRSYIDSQSQYLWSS